MTTGRINQVTTVGRTTVAKARAAREPPVEGQGNMLARGAGATPKPRHP